MSTTIGLPIEIVLDEMTIFDMRNKVISQIQAVYNLTSEQIIEKVHALHPNGNVTYTELKTRSNLQKFEKIVTSKKLKRKGIIKGKGKDVKGKAQGPWDAVVFQDPEKPDRYFIQVGDLFYGSGRRINKEGAVLIILAVGATLCGLGIVGLGFYGVSEGYDVDLNIGFTNGGFDASISVRKSDSGGNSDDL